MEQTFVINAVRCYSISINGIDMLQKDILICRYIVQTLSKVYIQFGVVQSLSRVRFGGIPWAAACQASLSFTICLSLLRLMFVESVMPSNHLILCCPLLYPQSFQASGFFFFSSESTLCIRWPKYQSFSISPSKEYLELVSFKID